jgi:hypothetical protein
MDWVGSLSGKYGHSPDRFPMINLYPYKGIFFNFYQNVPLLIQEHNVNLQALFLRPAIF